MRISKMEKAIRLIDCMCGNAVVLRQYINRNKCDKLMAIAAISIGQLKYEIHLHVDVCVCVLRDVSCAWNCLPHTLAISRPTSTDTEVVKHNQMIDDVGI